MKRNLFSLFLILVLLLTGLTACQPEENTVTFSGDSIAVQGKGATAEGSNLKIHQAGTYVLSGTLNDGQITVETAGNVTLILAGVTLNCAHSAPIYVKQADLVTFVLKEGTENTVTDGDQYTYPDGQTEPDAAIFSECDLIFTGTGTLTVNANHAQGIMTKDDLTFESGTYTIRAATHGIKGKDRLYVNGGVFQITATVDGMKATNVKDSDKGKVELRGGSIDIVCGDDGISAVTKILITGGTLNINTRNNGLKSENLIDIQSGQVTIKTDDKGLVCQTKTGSDQAKVTVNGVSVTFQ